MKSLRASVAGANEELGSAHPEYRRRSLHFHRIGGLLGYFPGYDRQSSPAKRGFEGAFVRRRVERVSFDGKHAIGADRQKRIVDERNTCRSVGSGHHSVGRLQMRSFACRDALAAALEIHRTLGDSELRYITRPACDRRHAARANNEKPTNDDQTSGLHNNPPIIGLLLQLRRWPAPAR